MRGPFTMYEKLSIPCFKKKHTHKKKSPFPGTMWIKSFQGLNTLFQTLHLSFLQLLTQPTIIPFST